jgi:hypothetical protein
MIFKHGSYYVKWYGSIYVQLSQRLKIILIVFEIYLYFLIHRYIRFIFHKYTPISYFIKWNEIISFLISCLSYILT